jgi:GAF domain-containing protein
MHDLDESESPTQIIESSVAKTRKLPRLPSSAPEATKALTLDLSQGERENIQEREDFQAGQSRILGMIAANSELGEILKRLVLLIESQSPEMICSVLLLSKDGDHIRHGAAPSLPEEYVNAINGAPIGPKHGSCGTAMFRGKPVIVSDIMTDPLWEDYRDLAAASGLRACWSTPILSGQGKVLGSFAMYYREPRTPTGDESRLTEVATRIAGLAIERQVARDALARTQVELAQAGDMGDLAHAAEQPLAMIIRSADQCIELLNECPVDVEHLRNRLLKIQTSGRYALDVIARMRELDNG